MKKKHIVFIHGANATYKSFNYIVKGLRVAKSAANYSYLNYDSHNSFYSNLDAMKQELSKLEGPVMIVAHSLGGIYAVHLYDCFPDKITNVITLSTPYSGVANANIMQWIFPYHQLLHDVGSFSGPIVESKVVEIKIPWLQVVTTSGDTPWMNPFIRNDGVVSRYSMTSRDDIEYYYTDSNHYEVVADADIVELISNSVNKFIS